MRRGLGVAFASLLTAGMALVVAPPATAAKPALQGWWRSSVNVLGIDITAILDPSTVDVPTDGLLVAGGTAAAQPQAIAALAYQVNGEVAGPLRLMPHAATATVPGSGAMACPLDNPTFKAAQGGLITDAPKYDCLGAVTAKVEADGAYSFDVSTLVRGDVVAVAILPTTTTSRIVFAAPGDDSLKVTPATTAPPASPAPAGDLAATATAGAGAVDLPSGSVAGSIVTVPASTPPAAATTGATGSSPVAAIGSGLPVSSRGSAGRAYALLGLVAAAGLAWALAGRGRRTKATA